MGFLESGSVGGEERSFVLSIANQDRNAVETALLVKVVALVGDQTAIDDREPIPERHGLGGTTREWLRESCRKQILDVQLAKAIGGSAVSPLQESLVLELHVSYCAEGGPEGALRDSSNEQISLLAATISSQVVRDCARTGRVTMNNDVVRVATKLLNVLLDPVKKLALVEQTGVQVTIASRLEALQKAKNTNAVIEADRNDVVVRLLDNRGSVDVGVAEGRVTTILDVDPDGQLRVRIGVGRLVDVGKETVLTEVLSRCLTNAYTDGLELKRVNSIEFFRSLSQLGN